MTWFDTDLELTFYSLHLRLLLRRRWFWGKLRRSLGLVPRGRGAACQNDTEKKEWSYWITALVK